MRFVSKGFVCYVNSLPNNGGNGATETVSCRINCDDDLEAVPSERGRHDGAVVRNAAS